MMRGIYVATEHYVLNPRYVNEQSAFLADMDWVHAFNTHLHWHRYEVDQQKKVLGR